ncbi:uncharacterized protein LOC126412711 [Schistocerca serialis cubense]|uniref:uncharacterized protein LOC126412711 n=1 Tax=Schistocerca serialis cubense TaxID=2023355 RepID=UPI00214E57C0|nr:uncharacterized protein LOC126412711 [Schistocerca serialis cubense]
MMVSSMVLLIPLLFAGAVLADTCTLPDASTETFSVTTAHKKWYQQYRYSSTVLDALGCLILTQDPGAAANQMTLSGAFSQDPSAAVTADVTIDGNRLHSTYYGTYGEMLTAERNLVYGSADIFIEHFCMESGDEMTFIFTTAENPSGDLVNQIWEEVDARPEIDRSKFQKVSC